MSEQTQSYPLLLHFRTRPAIPSLFVLFVAVLMPMMFADVGGKDLYGMRMAIVMTGLCGSTALAVGAGFCTLSVQLLWLALSPWVYSYFVRTSAPDYCLTIFYMCALAVVAMFFLQLWRIKTGKFVPTVQPGSEG